MADQRVVLTTGANSGIGLATALELARRGFRSVGTVRSEEKAEVLAKAAADAGVAVETALLDVTDADGCDEVVERFRPYGLVNNAGYSVTGAVEDVGDDEARHALETMVVAPMRLARLSLPHMRPGGGRIVNVSSVMGITSTALTGWYQAAKHALEAVSDALRVEVAGDGVRVVLIEPGGFRTGIWDEGRQEVARRQDSRYDTAYQRGLQGTRLVEPLMGDPGRVARVIAGAVSARRPRPRYLVGYDAQMLAWVERLTVSPVKDAVTRRFLGL
ncbi:MAG TPA: SDR family NAD(P)-dependent oxidoreductase [Acidimicrobiales bacterium]|nr:SDR family NAD(P)-dependent oxidoreductase [Acidimicrobiales bacterium]